MEWQQKRKADLEKSLLSAVHILNGYEQQLLYATDPQERAKTEQQIDLIKKNISDFQVELDSVENQIKKFSDLPLENTTRENQFELLKLIGEAHLLQASRNSHAKLQEALENTPVIIRAKQDIEDQVRNEVEEKLRKDITHQVIDLFEDEIRKKLEQKANKSKKKKSLDEITDEIELKIKKEIDKPETEQKINNEVERKLEIEFCKDEIKEKVELEAKKQFQIALNLKKKIELLKKEVTLPIDKIQSFFECEQIESHIFKYLCSYFNLNECEVVDTTFLEILVLFVPKIRLLRCGKIQDQCGTLHILDFSRPISLGDLYVDVNILNEPVSYRYLEISDLPKIYNPETDEVDRFGLGEVRQPRVPGMNLINRFSKLMILGKPGAGKSTFLQHLAIQCIQGGILSDRIPIFIRLKTFSENTKDSDLLRFIAQEINNNCETADETKVIELLSYGRAFVLLDGLDEVSQEDSDRVVKQISDFCEKYHRNKFVITCRIAAQQYRFFGFTYVEVADFNQEQIEDFAKNFFIAVDKISSESGLTKALNFINHLKSPENSQIREISVTPILLTLTCLVFLSKAEFPTNRAQLYQDGIDILLSKWDKSRHILREDIYKNLSISQKKELLTYIASIAFERNSYFLDKQILEEYIDDFLKQITKKSNGSIQERLGSVVLKSIEAQHGLLIERAHNIYSFSHLTFQEYFTARKYVNSDLFETLGAHVISEKRWREVFLLSTDLIDSADQLLWFTKIEVDKILAIDNKVQEFLVWLKEKSSSSQIPFNPSTIRAFYFSLVIAYYSNLEKSLSDRRSNNLRVERLLDRKLGLTQNSHRSFSRDKSLMNTLSLATALIEASEKSSIAEERSLIREQTLALIKLLDSHSIWLPKIRDIGIQFPNPSASSLIFAEWWKMHGESWIKNLRSIMIEYSNLGHDWGFSVNQVENLKKYYSANEYILGLLDGIQNLSSSMRSNIKKTMLLPIADVQRVESLLME
jgi:predicted NACHT family NTPase